MTENTEKAVILDRRIAGKVRSTNMPGDQVYAITDWRKICESSQGVLQEESRMLYREETGCVDPRWLHIENCDLLQFLQQQPAVQRQQREDHAEELRGTEQ